MDYRKPDKGKRSAKYQNIFNEKLVDTEVLSIFSNEDALYYHLNPYHYDERALDLEDLLKKKLWDLLYANLTDRQKEIINLLRSNKTQSETAALLNINQSSVVKSIRGNCDYSGGKQNKVVYGGIIRKALKALEKDEEIQEIIKQLAELRDESW